MSTKKTVKQTGFKKVLSHFKSQIAFYGAVLAIAGTIFGAPYFLDARYAKASDLASTNLTLEQKILADKFSQVESHIWSIQEHFKNLDKAPDEVKQELRDLQALKDRLKTRLDELDRTLGVTK